MEEKAAVSLFFLSEKLSWQKNMLENKIRIKTVNLQNNSLFILYSG